MTDRRDRPIRVLIADDEDLVRTGIRLVLEPAPDIAVVAEAADGTEAVHRAMTDPVDVVLMDIRMPGMDGLSALEQLARWPSAPPVVVLTTFDLNRHLHRALRAGAAGFLLKDADPTELITAVRKVAEGGAMLARSLTKRLIADYASAHQEEHENAEQRLAVLTPRERDIAETVSQGLSNAEIAARLNVTETSVKAHVSRSLTKLGLTNRVQLALLTYEAALHPRTGLDRG